MPHLDEQRAPCGAWTLAVLEELTEAVGHAHNIARRLHKKVRGDRTCLIEKLEMAQKRAKELKRLLAPE